MGSIRLPARPFVTSYQRPNRLSDFYEKMYNSLLEKIELEAIFVLK